MASPFSAKTAPKGRSAGCSRGPITWATPRRACRRASSRSSEPRLEATPGPSTTTIVGERIPGAKPAAAAL